MDTMSFQAYGPEKEALSEAQNGLLCCLKSRSEEERDKKEMRKCNEATLNKLRHKNL